MDEQKEPSLLDYLRNLLPFRRGSSEEIPGEDLPPEPEVESPSSGQPETPSLDPAILSLDSPRRNFRWAALLVAVMLTGYALRQLPQMPREANYGGIFFAWVVAISAYFLAVGPVSPAPGRDWRAWWQANRWLMAAVILLALVAWGLRFWNVESIPYTFSGDEASQGKETLRVMSGEIGNPFSTGWFAVPTMSFFFNSIFIRLLGPTVLAMRLPWTIVGALTVVLAYLTVARLKGPRLGLLTAALLAVYHFHIHYSRLGSVQASDPFFVTLAFFFLYRALERKNPRDWALTGAVCAGGLYFYTGGRLTIILVAAVLLYEIIRAPIQFWREHSRGALIALGAFLVVAAPMLQFAYRHTDDFNARINQVGIFQSGWLEREVEIRGASMIEILWDQFRRATLAFNFYPDRTIWYGLRQPLLDPLFGILFLLGLGYASLRAIVDRGLLPMVLWWWSGVILGGMLTESPPSSMRLVTLTVPTCFFIALALEKLFQLLKEAFPALSQNTFLGVRMKDMLLGLSVLVFGFISLQTYFVKFTPRRIYGSPRGELATMIVPYLNEHSPEYRIVFVGAPWMYFGFSTIPFLVQDADGVDLMELLTGPIPADTIPEGRGAVFVIMPERINELEYIQQTYPNGELQTLTSDSEWKTWVTLYTVAP